MVFYIWIIKNFESPWIAGGYLAFSIPLILTCSDNVWLNYLACIIPFTGVFLSKSLTAILSVGIGSIYFLVKKKQYKSFFLLVIVIFLLAILLVPKSYLTEKFNKDIRLETWGKSINLVGIQFIGSGLRSYKHYGFMEGADTLITHAHNEYLEMYCEQGIIGTILLLCFIISLLMIQCPVEYKTGLIMILVFSFLYYPIRIACLGLMIIIYLGIILKYKEKANGKIENIGFIARN